MLENDGQTKQPRPSRWVPPQTRSRKGPAPQRERLHPSSPAKVTVEDLAKQWPASAWQRFRLLEGHKGPLVADFLALRAVLPRNRLPGPETLGGDPAQGQRPTRGARMEVLSEQRSS